MGKVFGMLFFVALIWVGLELYLEGPSRAFGGAFAFAAAPEPPASSRAGRGSSSSFEQRLSAPQRAGAAVERAQRAHEERYQRLLGD